MSDAEPTEQEVNEALARLLAWPEIARSQQLARFLEYIVDRRLRGDIQAIKAYSIAVDVFGRPQDFDPQVDPIVRVQARRLRGLIEQFYQGPGAAEAVRIDLPTGRYVPEFSRVLGDTPRSAPEETPPAPPWTSPWVWGSALVAILVVAIVAIYLERRNDTPDDPSGSITAPVILVMEMQSLTGAAGDIGAVAGLAVELVTDLEQFESLRVVYGGSGADVGGPSPDYVLSGIVRREAGGFQYSAILTEVAGNSVVWNKAIDVPPDAVADPEMLDKVSGELSRALGSPRGPLHRRARELLQSASGLGQQSSPYLCRVLFDLYRERSTAGSGERAQRCYADLSDAERMEGQVQAASAILLAEGILGAATGITVSERLALAGEMLAGAVVAAPLSGFVWEQRARFYEMLGEDGPAEAAYSSALQLNPANTDTLAARARHLALVGRLADAAPLAQMAIASAPNPPSWYLIVPSLQALREGDYRLAAIYAQSYAEADRELGPILAVMAAQGLGDAAIVASYLPRVLEVPSFRQNGVLTQLRRRISDETLIRDIRTALLGAGVPPAVLTGAF